MAFALTDEDELLTLVESLGHFSHRRHAISIALRQVILLYASDRTEDLEAAVDHCLALAETDGRFRLQAMLALFRRLMAASEVEIAARVLVNITQDFKTNCHNRRGQTTRLHGAGDTEFMTLAATTK